jgi:arylsulfatase A-like enzyme
MYWSISYLDRYETDGGMGAAIRATKEDGLSQDMYDHSVLFMNDQLQCIVNKLKEIGQLDNTVIIVTADHGEGLGAHGIWGHGEIYDNVMHIPLILWGPGIIPSNKQIEEFTQHVDLAPTVLDLAGVRLEGLKCGIGGYKYKLNTVGYTIPVEFEGTVLLPVIEGKESTGREFVIAEMRRSPREPGVRAIFDGEWKLLARPTDEPVELYNLKDDPMEKINIIDRYPEKRDKLMRKLIEWKRAHIGDAEDPMIEVYKPFEVK